MSTHRSSRSKDLRIVPRPLGRRHRPRGQLRARRGRGARARRRVGLGQDHGRAVAARLPAPRRRDRRRRASTIDDRDLLDARSPGSCASSAAALISYVPQDPGSALNPALRIGMQLREILEVHGFGASDSRAREAHRGDDGRGAAAQHQGRSCAATRISSPAASSSAWRSPWRSPAGPRSSCSTSRPPASTSRRRRTCSTPSATSPAPTASRRCT